MRHPKADPWGTRRRLISALPTFQGPAVCSPIVGKDLGWRRQQFSGSQIRNARRLIEAGEPATQVGL